MGKTFTSIRRSLSEISGKGQYPAWKEKLVDIKDWLHDKFVLIPRQYYQRIERVIGWIPVVWNNYDWDHGYLFEVMRYKLSRMEKNIRTHGHAADHIKTADTIKVAKLTLDRIINHDYTTNATIPLDKEYGGWSFDFSSRRLEKVYKKPLTQRQIHYYEKATSRAYKHSDYMEKQDIEFLFKYIQKHHRKWWD